MVPVALLTWIVCEIAAYVYFARNIFHLGWPATVLYALFFLLALRAAMVATTFAQAARHGSPLSQFAAGQRRRLMFEEYRDFLFTFLLLLPFERLWMGGDRLRHDPAPILLVHGYGVSRGSWWALRRRLEAAGHTVATLSMIPAHASIGKMVPQLGRRIEEVCRATGAARVTLVAHSMGGLVCRSYLARHGHERVERLITLATPHAGTELARFGLGRNAREMVPGSLWLRDMAGEAPGIPVLSLRNPVDNYVMPQDNQRLPGAVDRELPPVGHITMLYDPAVADIVIDACRHFGKRP